MACSCDSRCFFICVCVLQLVAVSIRQALDFLGFQWTSIIANFCQITVLILGLFGAYRYKRRIIAVYATWTLIWIGWNIFVICLYLDIGILKLNDHIISMNLAITDTHSWLRNTTFSCDSQLVMERAGTSGDMTLECVDYRYIEVFLAGIQIVFACIGFIISCYVIGVLEDDSASFDFVEGFDDERKSKDDNLPHHLQPLVRNRVSEE